MKENIWGEKMLFASHLEEIDDLRSYGRDAPLAGAEKDTENLESVVSAIVSTIKESGKKAVMFVTSPKIRAKETAYLAGTEIRNRMGDIKIRYSVDDNLRPPEQGEFNLPESYTPGTFFEGLNIASKIFIEESLGPSKNMNYRFGDPMIRADHRYKYPELVKYFKSSGETYAESLIRIFSSVIQMSQKVDKLGSSVEVVLISHGFVFHILRGLVLLGEQMKKKELKISEGDVAAKIWDIYKNNTMDFKSLAYVSLDISNLKSRDLISLLSAEVEHLKRISIQHG